MSVNIQKAIIFATQKHEGQKRKGTDIPYIVIRWKNTKKAYYFF